MAMTADADGLLNGTKTWISNGGIADFYTVFARGPAGISAYLVDADAPGLRVAERIDVIAPHPLATLEFDATSRASRSATPGRGMPVALATLDVFRSTVGAAALGMARRALDEAVARAASRELFGAPMAAAPDGAGQARRHGAGRRRVRACSSTARPGRATCSAAASPARRRWPSCTPRRPRSARSTPPCSCSAGSASPSGHPVERLYREIRALRIYEGASEVQQLIIARAVLAAHERGEVDG